MKKPYVKSFAVLLVFLLCSKAFAYGGVLSDQKELKVNVTDWFDIIYPPECEKSAEILTQNADRIYAEITAEYGLVPSFRLPVVLTPDCEVFNAYHANYPYNRIVIYDTLSIEELDVNTEGILSVFTHELTHAVTFNITSKFMLKVQKIFGDAYSLSFWLTSRGMGEGAAVAMESLKGEGRLNSEYVTFMVKQAKLEEVFPDYYDIQCSEDVYPYEDIYFFNGMFNAWLQKKYGMEKYSKLWYSCINMQAMDFAGAFEDVYGTTIFDEWDDFKNQIQVPSGVASSPLKDGTSRDFFVREAADWSIQNDSGRYYDSLVYGKKGIAYVDRESRAVFFVSNEKLGKALSGELKEIKPEKLFTLSNIQKIRFSVDGNFIIADYVNINGKNYSKAEKIYSLFSGSMYSAKTKSAQDGILIEENGKTYFVYKTFTSQYNSIKIEEVELSKDKKKIVRIGGKAGVATGDANTDGSTIVTGAGNSIDGSAGTIRFPYDVNPYALTPLSNGRFAFIVKDGLSFAVCVSDTTGKIIKTFSQPAPDFIPRYLSSDENPDIINFTWTKNNTFPRYGNLNIKTGECRLQTKDISGGVYNPVRVSGKLIYIGNFFTQPRLLVMEKEGEFQKIKLSEGSVRTGVGAGAVAGVNSNESTGSQAAARSNTSRGSNERTGSTNAPTSNSTHPYNPFDYYRRGVLIPFSTITSVSHSKDSTASATLPVGLSYTSSNPWGDKEFTGTFAYGPQTNSIGLDLRLTGGSDTGVFKYAIGTFFEFDQNGFKQTYADLDLSSLFRVGNHSSLGFGLISNVWTGHSNYSVPGNSFFGTLGTDGTQIDFYASEIFYLTYKSIIKTGPGRNSYAGFSLTTLLKNADNFNLTGDDWSRRYTELGFLSSIYLPNLIPIECKRGLIYNLPLRLDFNLFTDSTKVSDNIVSDLLSGFEYFYEPVFSLAGVKAELMVFGADIQHAIPAKSFLWIYLHDFHVSFLYSGGYDYEESQGTRFFTIKNTPDYIDSIKNGNISYEQYFGVRIYTGLSFNFGLSTKTSLVFDFYPVNTKNKVFMAISFGTEF